MKYLWKRATGLLLTSALVLGLAACGGTPTGNTNPPEDPGTQQTTQPVAPDSGAAGEKLVYSNGGPEEFFETPWLNPGTYVYNKAVYGHLIVADENPIPSPTTQTRWLPMSTARTARHLPSLFGTTLTGTTEKRSPLRTSSGALSLSPKLRWPTPYLSQPSPPSPAARPATLSMTPSAVSLSTGRRSSLPLIRSPPTLC